MGVYAKGMAMPNKCSTCALRFECDYSLGEYGIGYHTFRPKECPAIEIHPRWKEVFSELVYLAIYNGYIPDEIRENPKDFEKAYEVFFGKPIKVTLDK